MIRTMEFTFLEVIEIHTIVYDIKDDFLKFGDL